MAFDETAPSFSLRKDRNNEPTQLLPGKRPRAMQRSTAVNSSSATDITLNTNTTFVRLYSKSYDAFVTVKDSVATTGASIASHEWLVPAGRPMDFWLPEKKS